MPRVSLTVKTNERRLDCIHTHKIFFMDVGGSIQMKQDGQIISVVGSVEFGDIEQGFAAQAIVKITCIESRVSADIEVTAHAIEPETFDVHRVRGIGSGGEGAE